MSQYIGKTISLISITDNRYVGLLESIDSEKGIVTLNKVRCFGTEGRKNWTAHEILPNPTIYDTVTFNGNDVKDLNILDCHIDEIHPVLPPMMPSQVQQQYQHNQSVPTSELPKEVPAAMTGYGVYSPEGDNKNPVRVHEPQKQRKKSLKQHKTSQKPSVSLEEFDFESNNARLNKNSSNEQGDNSQMTKKSSDEIFYDKKSSFFDTISTSTETNTNMKWHEERQLNLDTFGQTTARFSGNWNGRGRGRGGHRRYYKGRHRNNFKNNFNNFNTENIEF